MGNMTAAVRDRLIELQGGRTDAEMAALLGVSRPHWTHIRAHRRQLTYALTKRALAHFPELYPIVMQDLAVDAPAEAGVR